MSGVAVLETVRPVPFPLSIPYGFLRRVWTLGQYLVLPVVCPVAWLLAWPLRELAPRLFRRWWGVLVLPALAAGSLLWVRHTLPVRDDWWTVPLREAVAYQRPYLSYALARSRAQMGYDPTVTYPDWPNPPSHDPYPPLPFPFTFGPTVPPWTEEARSYIGHALPFAFPLALVFAALGDALDAVGGVGSRSRHDGYGGADSPLGGESGKAGNGKAGTRRDDDPLPAFDREAERVVDASKAGIPKPRAWLVKDAVPMGQVTTIRGRGGLGKSTIIQALCVCVAEGLDWLGMATTKGIAIFVEGEMENTDDAQRRGWALSRGYGLDRPPTGLYYISGAGLPLDSAAACAKLRERMLRCWPWYVRLWAKITGRIPRPTLVGYDSLTMAGGLTTSDPKVVTAVFAEMKRWVGAAGAVVVADHQSKGSAKDWRKAESYGSAFKRNNERSGFAIGLPDNDAAAAARGGGANLELCHDKHNFGPDLGSLYLAFAVTQDERGDDVYRYTVVPAAPALAPRPIQEADGDGEATVRVFVAAALPVRPVTPVRPVRPALPPPVHPTIRSVIAEYGGRGVSLDVLATRLGVAKKTVQNRVSEMRKAGEVVDLPGRLVCLCDDAPPADSASDNAGGAEAEAA